MTSVPEKPNASPIGGPSACPSVAEVWEAAGSVSSAVLTYSIARTSVQTAFRRGQRLDWYLDPSDSDAPRRLRVELETYLERHGTVADSDVWAGVTGGWELMINAIRHAPGPVWVSLSWEDDQALIEVHDMGFGFALEQGLAKEPGPDGGFGLKLVSELGEDLRARAKSSGGARVSARLPVYRKQGESLDYAPGLAAAGIPLSHMAEDTGFVGRETFLFGLAANLVRNVELDFGPEAANRLVNEVGRQMGVEMETAYRKANDVTGPLSTTQIAELFVGLKAAIDGDFYLIEVTDDRIVLGNRSCPFGASVQQAPSLCQMTSAVFGGIAANSRRTSRVHLEERIAVGDIECRVVVELGQPNS